MTGGSLLPIGAQAKFHGSALAVVLAASSLIGVYLVTQSRAATLPPVAVVTQCVVTGKTTPNSQVQIWLATSQFAGGVEEVRADSLGSFRYSYTQGSKTAVVTVYSQGKEAGKGKMGPC